MILNCCKSFFPFLFIVQKIVKYRKIVAPFFQGLLYFIWVFSCKFYIQHNIQNPLFFHNCSEAVRLVLTNSLKSITVCLAGKLFCFTSSKTISVTFKLSILSKSLFVIFLGFVSTVARYILPTLAAWSSAIACCHRSLNVRFTERTTAS